MPKKRVNPIEKMENCRLLLKLINTDYYTMLFRVVMYLGYYAANKLGLDYTNQTVYRDFYTARIGDHMSIALYDYRNSFCHCGDLDELYDKFSAIIDVLPVEDDMNNEVKQAVYLLQNRDRVV